MNLRELRDQNAELRLAAGMALAALGDAMRILDCEPDPVLGAPPVPTAVAVVLRTVRRRRCKAAAVLARTAGGQADDWLAPVTGLEAEG